ncbi:DUF4395 domain-containing protein [Radiobacillus kanasensis]|uniref:DUF4395 domain-containing protein n=1 Tax=Radiobacillus kanasensis TaxID=2844358 RepID=UPI001E3A35CC|nr:DUF4395 domain-containing protein [Radiobacillus kanasensis]UFT98345.1 DUF4395 domain-containing protein [Radiobacillus kanasensis]
MSIPKPLVQLNQSFLVITVLLAFVFHIWILAIPFVLGLITLITKKNPVILMGKRFLKKPSNEYNQEDQDQQLFNQWIATTCLGIALVAFTLDYQVIGYIFSTMVVAAAGLALAGYCIGCAIRYRYMMWKYNKAKAQ